MGGSKDRRAAIAAALSAFMLLLMAGCGKGTGEEGRTSEISSLSTGPADTKAETLFRESLRNLISVQSFRLSGSTDMDLSIQEGDRTASVGMHMTIREDVLQEDGYQRIGGEVETVGEGIPAMKIRMYLVDGSLYYESGGQWLRSEFRESFNPAGGTGQLMTAQSIALMLDSAESLTVDEVGEGRVVFSFILGRRYRENAMNQAGASLDEEQRKMLEKMYDTLNYRLQCTVDGERALLTGLIMEMRGSRFEIMPGYSMSMDIRGEFHLSDYGAPLSVELPPEAEGAQLVDFSEINPF